MGKYGMLIHGNHYRCFAGSECGKAERDANKAEHELKHIWGLVLN